MPGEDPGEDRDDVVHDQVVGGAGEGVEPGRVGLVRVENHQPVRDAQGEAGQDVGGEVAFGVDDHDAAAVGDVIQDQVSQEGGLAGAGRAEHVQVVPGISDGQ